MKIDLMITFSGFWKILLSLCLEYTGKYFTCWLNSKGKWVLNQISLPLFDENLPKFLDLMEHLEYGWQKMIVAYYHGKSIFPTYG